MFKFCETVMYRRAPCVVVGYCSNTVHVLVHLSEAGWSYREGDMDIKHLRNKLVVSGLKEHLWWVLPSDLLKISP